MRSGVFRTPADGLERTRRSRTMGAPRHGSERGKDDARNNLRDPTMRDRTEQRTRREHRSHVSHAKAPADHRGGRKD